MPSFNFLYWFSLFILLITTFICFRSILNPISIFVVWWYSFMLLGRQSWTGLYLPKDITYVLIMSSIWGYSIGFMISHKATKCYSYLHDVSFWSIFDNKKLVHRIRILFIIAFIFVLYNAFRVRNLLSIFSPSELRNMLVQTQQNILWGSFYMVTFRDFILVPSVYVFSSVFMYRYYFFNKYSDLLFLGLSFISFLLVDMTALSRGITFLFLIVFFIVSFYSKKIRPCENKHKFSYLTNRLFLALCLIFAVFILGFITLLRIGDSITDQGIVATKYFSQPFVLFDMRDKVMPTHNKFIGSLSLGGINTILLLLVRKFGLEGWNTWPSAGGYDIQTPFRVGISATANAHYTWCLPFYTDLGWIGVFIIPFCYGLLIGYLYKKSIGQKSIGLLIVFAFGHAFALMGIHTWRLQEVGPTLLMLVLLFLSRRRPAKYKIYSHILSL